MASATRPFTMKRRMRTSTPSVRTPAQGLHLPQPSGSRIACQGRELRQQEADRRGDRCRTENLTEGGGQVQRASRDEYARAIAPRYRRASKAEKGRILD